MTDSKKNPLRFLWLKKTAPGAAEMEKNLRAGAATAAKTLDQDGVQRKSAMTPDPVEDDDADTAEVEVVKALDIEGLTTALTAMVTELVGDAAPEDLSDRVMALISASVSESEGMMPEEGAAEDSTEVEMGRKPAAATKAADAPDEELPDEDEGDEDEDDGGEDIAKKLVSLLDDLVDGQAAMAEVQKQVADLAPLTKLPAKLDSLSKRLAAVEKRLSGGPRAASTAAEAEIDDDDELADVVKESEADEAVRKVVPGLFS